jgi:sensor histidine kinase YesM
MQIPKMIRLKERIKNNISNTRIQTRLFVSSVVLISAVLLSLYFLSFFIVSKLILQKQSEYELDSFRQVNSFFKSVFSSTDGYIGTLYKDQKVREILIEPFNENDPVKIVSDMNSIQNSINTILINKDFMDNVILLGKNNFSCIYSQNDFLLDTASINNFNFDAFLKGTVLKGYLNENSYPFYYLSPNEPSPSNRYEAQIENTIRNKIILIQLLKDENGVLDGIAIITFKPDIAASIIPGSNYERSMYLTDEKGNVIWKNSSQDTETRNLVALNGTEIMKYKGSTEKDLVAAYTLEPYNLKIISRTPVNAFSGNDKPISEYAILFGIGCFILTFLSSYFFSNNACRQLKNLSRQLSKDIEGLPGNISLSGKNGFYNNLSLRTKLYVHFGLSVILPTILFITFITYLNYSTYQNKIIELAGNSAKQIKQNIDYKLSNYDKLSIQTIFDDDIQSILNTKEYENNNSQLKLKVSEAFLNNKIKNKEILSLGLYDSKGNKIYSNIPFDNSPATDISPDFLSLMENSSNSLVYLGSTNDYLGLGPSLLFARNIRSKNSSFGKLLGYLVFSVDPEVINNIARDVKLGDTGIFFFSNKNGSIISNSSLSSSTFAFESIPALGSFNNEGYFTHKPAKDRYLVFFNTLNITSLKIVGIVPLRELISKVYPLIWYSLIVLLAYLFLILIISFIISRGIVRPLKTLEKHMYEIRSENFQVHMDYKGKDEIAILSENFNLMVNRLNKLIYENYQSKLRESELLFLEKEAQLNALQQQINPHFLYNTLESIKWMAYKIEANNIVDMTTALGKFFRGVINKGKGVVTFQEEIEHLENYIYIQKIRYQGKFDVTLEISDEIKEYKIIKLVLQPLVENAIIHGLEKIKQGGLITIRGTKSGDHIGFEIIDNGIGMSETELSGLSEKLFSSANKNEEKSSIGLVNVYNRLKLHSGDAGSFEILSAEGKGTTVKFTIPAVK